jgi:hypothetical protein
MINAKTWEFSFFKANAVNFMPESLIVQILHDTLENMIAYSTKINSSTIQTLRKN